MRNRVIILLFVFVLIFGCKQNYTPRPKGYFRIEFPEKSYQIFNEPGFPYQFEIPGYSNVKKISAPGSELYDLTISVAKSKADIHITYKEIPKNDKTGELENLLEDSRTLAYKHSIKADAIEERLFLNPASKVYGTIYLIGGNAASPMQFYLTDSVKHFLRGSFYIRNIPNIDSLKPVIDFIEPDIIRLIETTKWN